MRHGQAAYQPVELQVTNLDQTIDQREMKRTITGVFRDHVNVLHVSVFFQSDGIILRELKDFIFQIFL